MAGRLTVYVCVCKAIRLSEAVEAARAAGTAPQDLIETFGFEDSDACGRCANQILRISTMVHSELTKSKLNLAAT